MVLRAMIFRIMGRIWGKRNAPRPTAGDVARLRKVAKYHKARAVCLSLLSLCCLSIGGCFRPPMACCDALWQPTASEVVTYESKPEILDITIQNLKTYDLQLQIVKSIELVLPPVKDNRIAQPDPNRRWKVDLGDLNYWFYDGRQNYHVTIKRFYWARFMHEGPVPDAELNVSVTGPLSDWEEHMVASARKELDCIRAREDKAARKAEEHMAKYIASISGPMRHYQILYDGVWVTDMPVGEPYVTTSNKRIHITCQENYRRFHPLTTAGRLIVTPAAFAADVVLVPVWYIGMFFLL